MADPLANHEPVSAEAAPREQDTSATGADADQAGARRGWLLALALAVLVGLVFSAGLEGPMVFDDLDVVRDNPSIRSLRDLGAVLNPPPEMPTSGRPLANLSIAVNYAIHGDSPLGYKLVSLALHVVNALLVFAVLRLGLGQLRRGEEYGLTVVLQRHRDLIAFAIAALWAIHPLNTETVAYITQRTELMMAAGLLGALYCSQRGLTCRADRRRLWQVAAVSCAAFSMLSKEVAVVIPLLVYCYDALVITGSWRNAWRKHHLWHLSLAASWLLLIWTYAEHPRPGSTGSTEHVSSWSYLLTQSQVLCHYLRLSLWPDPLVLAYDWRIVTRWQEAAVTGPVILSLVIATALGLWREHRLSLLGAWFFLILAPSSSVLPIITEVAAERRMYLPLIAVVTLLVVGAIWLSRRLLTTGWNPRKSYAIGGTALVCLLIALAAMNVQRLREYRSDIGLWQANVEDWPTAWRSHHNLTTLYMDRGEPKKARHHIEQALANLEHDDQVNIHLMAFFVYRQLGEMDKAASHLQRAREIDPARTEQELERFMKAMQRGSR